MQSVRSAPSASSSCRYSERQLRTRAIGTGRRRLSSIDAFAEPRDRQPTRDLIEPVAVDVRDEEPGRVRPEVDGCDADHLTGRNTRSQRVRRCAVSSDPSRTLELRARERRRSVAAWRSWFERSASASSCSVRAARSSKSSSSLVNSAARPLPLTPEREPANDDDEQADERERETDEKGGEDHDWSLEAALRHPEDAAHDLARERPAARRL